jgi:hypothetical protein
MSLKITRRRLAAAALGSAVVHAAQRPAASPPEDLNAAAKEQLRKNAEALGKVELSMGTEPAFHFKA